MNRPRQPHMENPPELLPIQPPKSAQPLLPISSRDQTFHFTWFVRLDWAPRPDFGWIRER